MTNHWCCLPHLDPPSSNPSCSTPPSDSQAMSESPGQQQRHGSHDDDHDDEKRPSFKAFLRQCKDVGRSLKFVPGRRGAKAVVGSAEDGSAGVGGGGDPAGNVGLTRQQQPAEEDASSALGARRQAQARRAQVRRAQVQHRKRKADYTKQLETEVADRRNMIADLDAERALLRAENEAARALLMAAAASILPPQQQQEVGMVSPSCGGGGGGSSSQPVSHFADMGVDDLVVSLAMDEAMGAQAWRVSQAPSSSPLAAACGQGVGNGGVDDEDEEGEDVPGCGRLGAAQTQQAINFILAMEHCCKDHFRLADLDPGLHETWGLPEPTQEPAPTGHHLMATALALRDAPSSIAAADARRRPSPTALVSELAGGADSWRASGLTLAALHGLAQSLAPLAGPELTPVQAWFELAARFPAALLLRADVSDALKRGFVGVVKCVRFGAAVEREAFEGVVFRVLGADPCPV
ncbi:hypothetical protein RB597_004615 [Gaeumannomyces tritici]